MASASDAQQRDQRSAWLERRYLLEYVLKDFTKRGGRLLCPPGTSTSEPWLLDNLDVKQVIAALQTGLSLDLGRCSLPSSLPAVGFVAGESAPIRRSNSSNPGATAGPTNVANIPTYIHHASVSSIGGGAPNPFASGAGGSSSSAAPNPFEMPPDILADDVNPFLAPPASAPDGAPNPFAGPSSSSSASLSTAPKSAAQRVKSAAQMMKRPFQSFKSSGGGATSADGGESSSKAPSAPPTAALDSGGAASRGPATTAALFLDLPQLQTGLEANELREVAFLLFCANVNGGAGARASNGGSVLLDVLRTQLEVDDARARDTLALLHHLAGAGLSASQCASLETLVRLLGAARPPDFGAQGFPALLRWRDIMSHVVESQLSRAAMESWSGGDTAGARRAVARLKGALRRLDVRSADEYDDEEYHEAAASVSDSASQVAGGCGLGWRFPWAMRVRLCEVLLHGAFNPQDLSQYADQHALLVNALEQQLFPQLGVTPVMHRACFAWAHFQVFVSTRSMPLLRALNRLMQQLDGDCKKLGPASRHEDPFQTAGELLKSRDVTSDRLLATEVSLRLVTYAQLVLSDYHTQFPKGENMQGLLDMLVTASRCRGDGEEAIQAMLTGVVRTALETVFAERAAPAAAARTPEGRLLMLVDVVRELVQQELTCYARVLGQHLGADALPVAAARLHALYAAELTPWLNKNPVLNDASVAVFRAAGQLEADLAALVLAPPPIAGLALPPPSKSPPLPAGFRRWDLAAPLKRALDQWVSTQVSSLDTWTARQLASETWKPLSESNSCSQSAIEVARFMDEAVDALFAMGLRLPMEAVTTLLAGVTTALNRYCGHVSAKWAPLQVIPPLPPPTRFKKPEVAKQEAGEAGKATKLPKLVLSVPKIQTGADYKALSTDVTTSVLTSCIASLHFLRGHAEQLAQSVPRRWQQQPPPGLEMRWQQPQERPQVLDSQLQDCCATLTTGLEQCCTFLADKIIFWDLRYDWLETLYRHHVAARRVDPLLDRLHATLTSVCGGLGEGVRGMFALCLLRSSSQALSRVYLDGGPCRWFTAADVPLLEQDVIRLKTLFFADGEGISREVIDQEMSTPTRLLRAMALDTSPLMEFLKTAKARGRVQVTVAGQSYWYEEAELMRVLARRPDRIGSKLLKKEYKMPKSLKP